MADEPLEEQLKKKKRAVLLVLFLLLLVTAGTAVSLEPAPALTPEMAQVNPNPSPAQPTPPPTTATLTPTPQQAQGDEWSNPATPSPNSINETTPPATASAPAIVETRNNTITPERPQPSEFNLSSTPQEVSLIPTRPGVETEEAISTPAVSPIAPISIPDGISAATASPPSALEEAVETFVIPTSAEDRGEPDENQAPLASVGVTPAATEISKRINESWDILDGDEAAATETGDSSKPLTSTTTLSMSEAVAIIPPDGLPVTGISIERGMNWVALAVTVVLIGAGSIALLYPKVEQK